MTMSFTLPSFLSILAGAAGETWKRKKLQHSCRRFSFLLFAAASVCSAMKEKIGVMNMSPDNIQIKIWNEHKTEISKEIPIDCIKPEVLEIEYEKELKLDVFGPAEKWGSEGLTHLPIFNGHTPEDLKQKIDNFPKNAVTFITGITEKWVTPVKEKERIIEIVPVWTIHSSTDATFAVYLLYTNGTIFASPNTHDYTSKRKVDELDDYMGSEGPMHKRHKAFKGMEKIRIGFYNKINEDIEVHISDDSLHMTITPIRKDVNSLQLFEINVKTNTNICDEEAFDRPTINIIRHCGTNDEVEATYFVFAGYSLDELKNMILVPPKEKGVKGNEEYIFVWTFFDMFSWFDIHQLNVDEISSQLHKQISREPIEWSKVILSDED